MTDSRDMLTSVARMYYLEDMGQSEIADLYQISRSTVSRMLTSARQIGIVRITVDDFDPRDRDLEKQLQQRFDLRRVAVVRELGGAVNITRRAIANVAAPEVSAWMSGKRRIGVTGGRTLGELMRAIPHCPEQLDRGVYQMMGAVATTPGANEPGEVTRALAARLHARVHMLNMPAYVEDGTLRDAIVSHDQIKAMWRMFQRLQLAYIGVGSIDDSMFVDHGAVTKSQRNVLKRQGAVAELCGRFVDAAGVEVDQPLRDRALSIDLDVLRSIPEVVLVTSGRHRGESARAVLANQFANAAVMDDACARGVLGI